MSESIVLKGYHWPQALLEQTPDDGLFFLSMNMTSLCNYRCPYCFIGHADLKRDPLEMPSADKLALLHEAKSLGCRVVVMPGRGEPLSDPDFWTVVEAAAELGLYVVIDTNIFLLDLPKIKRLAELPVSIFAKVDSLDRDVYEYSVGSVGSYPRFRDNLDMLVEHFHRPELDTQGRKIVRLGVNSVISTRSAPGIGVLHAWCAERDIYYTCRSPVRAGQAQPNWDDITGGQVEALRAVGATYARRDFTSATEEGHCGLYRFGITVENTGEIYVCPQSRTSIGNVRGRGLAALLNERNRRSPLNKEAGYCYAKDLYNDEGAFTRAPARRTIRIETLPA